MSPEDWFGSGPRGSFIGGDAGGGRASLLSAAITFMDNSLISISCILGKLRTRRLISVATGSFLYYNDLSYSYLLMQ